jgi:hypothetical protein
MSSDTKRGKQNKILAHTIHGNIIYKQNLLHLVQWAEVKSTVACNDPDLQAMVFFWFSAACSKQVFQRFRRTKCFHLHGD